MRLVRVQALHLDKTAARVALERVDLQMQPEISKSSIVGVRSLVLM